MEGNIMLLPSIYRKTILRPGFLPIEFDKCRTPNTEEKRFWNNFYDSLKNELQFPVKNSTDKIDPYFGYFGYRFHPVNLMPNYFHIGLDIMTETGMKIYPIAKSVFEYSGFSKLNGNYILLSHPELKTEDGYILYSMYLHLQKSYFHFNALQKIIRGLGGRSLTNIEINIFTSLGEAGATGNIKGLVPHLHLQLELRNKNGSIVAIDPAKALGLESKVNLTRQIKTIEEFKKFYDQNKEKLLKWSKLWNFV